LVGEGADEAKTRRPDSNQPGPPPNLPSFPTAYLVSNGYFLK